MVLPTIVTFALERLAAAGQEGYVVGGCVRDTLLGRTPSDWDLAVSATPAQMEQAFAGERLLPTGMAHGTMTLLYQGDHLEMTTYRLDGTYDSHRRPQAVTFTTSLEEDLARRDFTVNAMAYHPQKGLIDPFGGQADLEKGILRAVGNPMDRLAEDPLRILRGLRFAANLGFCLDTPTLLAMHRQKFLLPQLSGERVREELLGMLIGPNISQVLREEGEILFVLFPELAALKGFDQKSKNHCYDVWEHTLHTLDAIPPDPVLRLVMLLHDTGKPRHFTVDEQGAGHFYGHHLTSMELAKDILERLRVDNKMRARVLSLVLHHDVKVVATRENVKSWLALLGEEGVREFLLVRRADLAAKSPLIIPRKGAVLDAWEEELNQLLVQNPALHREDLAIGGRELLDMGLPPGPPVGKMLDYLLTLVMDETLENTRESLLEKAKELWEGLFS